MKMKIIPANGGGPGMDGIFLSGYGDGDYTPRPSSGPLPSLTRVAIQTTIALRSNWFCLSQRIWSKFEEGDAASGRVINVRGHDFEPSTKPSKSYLNRRDMNWSRHVE